MEIFKLLYANKLRLKRGKLLWIGLGVSLGYNILLLVMNYIELVNHIGNSIVAINWYLLSSFSTVGYFCPVLCSFFIGTDYSEGTVRNKVIAGHTRNNIYLANFITASAVNLFWVVVTTAVTAVLGTLLFGWHMVYPLQFLLQYFSGLLAIIALAGLFTLPAMLIHNHVISTVCSILLFFVLYSVETSVQRILFARSVGKASMVTTGLLSQTVLEFVYDFIPVGQVIQVMDKILHPVRAPVFSLVFTAVSVLFGIAVFRKKDLN